MKSIHWHESHYIIYPGDEYALTAKLTLTPDEKINLTDRDNLLTLAQLCRDAYLRLPTSATEFVYPEGLTNLLPVGWEIPGLRGYVWSTTDLKHMVVAFKGTSVSRPGSKADIIPTNNMDREQVLPLMDYANLSKDNLLFNCCPGKYKIYPAPVDCISDRKLGTCDDICISAGIRNSTSYYPQALASRHLLF